VVRDAGGIGKRDRRGGSDEGSHHNQKGKNGLEMHSTATVEMDRPHARPLKGNLNVQEKSSQTTSSA